MLPKSLKIKILFFITLMFQGNSWASPSPNEPTAIERSLIQGNIAVSEAFDEMAEGIDRFLVGKKITSKKNESSVLIENSTFSVEGESLLNTTSINVNLRLPNLEEYLQLKFSSYDERNESRNVKKGYLRKTPRENNYGASVGLFRKLGRVRTAFRPRIELRNPLKISHSLSFDFVSNLKYFDLNPKLELFATPDKGTGVYGALNLNFKINNSYSFTFLNDVEYEEKLHMFSSSSGFSVGQYLTDATSFSYNVLFDSDNRPNYHLDGYNFSVSWNHTLYKKILDYQLIPHLDFLKDRNFKGFAGIALHIRLNF